MNNTGGSGNFAIVDSDRAGARHYQNTALSSPVIDMSGGTSPQLEFATDLQPAVNSTETVDLSPDGGRTWSTVWRKTAFAGVPGPQTVVVPLPKAAGQARVQVRFGYLGQWSQYWEIDNVFIGERTCVAKDGGLMVGRVSDAAAGTALNGATVASVKDSNQRAVTQETPGDEVIGGGLYWLFTTATGEQQFTATMNGYASRTATVTVGAGEVTEQDFPLTAGNP